MKLLEETIRELKGEELEDERHAAVNLRLDLRIDESYIPDMNQRLGVYRKLASARSTEEVDAYLEELRDRYGSPPATIQNLAEHARIRLAADRIGLESLDRQGPAVVLKFRQDARLDPAWLLRLVQARGDLTLLPPAVLRLDLTAPVNASRPAAARPAGPAPVGRLRPKAGTADRESAASWWTSRATAAEVTAGFTREAMTAVARLDPAAKDGLFERLGKVLAQLEMGLVG
jgi:transcription-repair coupling factor (superfamily II helicase)